MGLPSLDKEFELNLIDCAYSSTQGYVDNITTLAVNRASHQQNSEIFYWK